MNSHLWNRNSHYLVDLKCDALKVVLFFTFTIHTYLLPLYHLANRIVSLLRVCVYTCMRCMTECAHMRISPSFLYRPPSSSPLFCPPALVGSLLCSVLVIPDVKSPFQLVLCMYFPQLLPKSENGKVIKQKQQFLLSPRGLVWNTPVFWKVLFIIVVGAGYSVGCLGMYSRLCFSFLYFFFL